MNCETDKGETPAQNHPRSQMFFLLVVSFSSFSSVFTFSVGSGSSSHKGCVSFRVSHVTPQASGPVQISVVCVYLESASKNSNMRIWWCSKGPQLAASPSYSPIPTQTCSPAAVGWKGPSQHLNPTSVEIYPFGHRYMQSAVREH
jgi:hypothetical protein